LLAALLCLGSALLPGQFAAAARGDDLSTADQLSRTGRHAEAALAYEELAKRPFFGPDARLSLLAAREYLAAGRVDDAARLAAQAERRARGDDAVLLARVRAEIALARKDPAAALAALRSVPEPWPAPLAAELLELRARAEFGAGRALDGIRSFEERARVVGSADARHANYQLLLDLLMGSTAAATVPAGATDNERAWLELARLLSTADTDPALVMQRATDWKRRHPHHPGVEFLPQQASSGPAVAATEALPAAAPSVVALLLPMSGRQQALGTAVRDGFLAACLADPASAPRVQVYDTAALGVGPAYQRAIAEKTQFVVGPLTRDEVQALVVTQQLPVPTLALNAYTSAAPPPYLFQFALDPEQEARAAAQRIAADGHVRGIALFPRNAWGDRLQAAFTAELQAAGVTLTSAQFYGPGDRDFSGPLRAALGRFGGAGDRSEKVPPPPRRDPVAEALDGPQFAFIAASPQAARAIKPQLRFQMTYDMPVYATSDALDPGTRASADMEGLVYPEIPWVLNDGAGAPGLWDVLQHEWAAAARGHLRLYAFGFDAFQLMRQLRSTARAVAVDGLTGELEVATDGRVQRRLQWARIEGGRPQAAAAGPQLAPPSVP